MRVSMPDRDVRRRRTEENEETLIGSFWKKTPPQKTALSHRWNDYTFRSVLAIMEGVLAFVSRTQLTDHELPDATGDEQIAC